MNKFINLLSFLLVINLLILGNLLVKQYNHRDLLPISYAKTITHDNDNYNLIISILKDINKNSLIKYADYIELNIIESMPNYNENKVAFTLSLPEQVSFIVIYSKKILKQNNVIYRELENTSIDYLTGHAPKILCIITTTTYKYNYSSSNFEK